MLHRVGFSIPSMSKHYLRFEDLVDDSNRQKELERSGQDAHQRKLAVEIFNSLEEDRIYTIRKSRWVHEERFDADDYYLAVETQPAQSMQAYFHVPPDPATVPLPKPLRTAREEVRYRIRRKLSYGFVSAFSNFFTELERMQGWKP